MKTDFRVRISGIEEISGRWFWTETEWDGTQRRYHTNANHEGLFELSGTTSKQVLGTTQFSLAGKSKAAIRSYLNRHANRDA